MDKLKTKVEDLKKEILKTGEKEYQNLSRDHDVELVKKWAGHMKSRPETIIEILFNLKYHKEMVIKYALAGYWLAEHSPPETET